MSQNPKKSSTYTAGSHSIYISGDSSTKKPEAYNYNFTYNISSGRAGLHIINDKGKDEENSIFNSLVNSQDNNINMPHENTENAQTDGNPIQNKANTLEKEYKEKMELLEKAYKEKMELVEKAYKEKMELQMALLEKEYKAKMELLEKEHKAKMELQMALLEKEYKAKMELLEKEYKAKMALLDEKEKKMEDD